MCPLLSLSKQVLADCYPAAIYLLLILLGHLLAVIKDGLGVFHIAGRFRYFTLAEVGAGLEFRVGEGGCEGCSLADPSVVCVVDGDRCLSGDPAAEVSEILR